MIRISIGVPVCSPIYVRGWRVRAGIGAMVGGWSTILSLGRVRGSLEAVRLRWGQLAVTDLLGRVCEGLNVVGIQRKVIEVRDLINQSS